MENAFCAVFSAIENEEPLINMLSWTAFLQFAMQLHAIQKQSFVPYFCLNSWDNLNSFKGFGCVFGGLLDS